MSQVGPRESREGCLVREVSDRRVCLLFDTTVQATDMFVDGKLKAELRVDLWKGEKESEEGVMWRVSS